ncbi:pre-miRNA 5'-monophosphate methyltransferase [Toxorhynchites rutilus septentrionalis]|uniref:pre-miRNA 5'-monophosphate methyltransferase n=1 Tax=Toxorhynchites rutilus septentrionalis TaxID=329112 RepID=UPI002479E852|nr:pre-miRNA 5'-monophosphate methyltransferase [Toxorhynchites rutilus septentrionalis]
MPKDKIQHGSYHQYYEFRSRDSRPQCLENCLRQCSNQLARLNNRTIHMLDIGCNSGKLSNSVLAVIQSTYGESQLVHMIGVDIDMDLVAQARSSYGNENLQFAQADISAIAIEDSEGKDSIAMYMERAGIRQFDYVFCFSVLMYVHLNHGDQGLQAVLDYVCSRANVLVLELQSWKKYRDHVRRMRREGEGEYPHFESLEWKGNYGRLEEHIKQYVISRGFHLVFEEGNRNEFNRSLILFSRNST